MLLSRRSFPKGTGALSASLGVQLPFIAQAAAQAAAQPAEPQTGEHYKKTTCVHCVNFCGQMVKMEGEIIRAVYPDPARAAVYNQGICPKGASGPFNTYNPYRIKAPLKRTNPKKGPDEDPGWVEISWEAALDEVARRLKKIRAEDPRKLIWHHDHGKYLIQDDFPKSFAKAFGTPNVVHRPPLARQPGMWGMNSPGGITSCTNAPELVGKDGHILKDAQGSGIRFPTNPSLTAKGSSRRCSASTGSTAKQCAPDFKYSPMRWRRSRRDMRKGLNVCQQVAHMKRSLTPWPSTASKTSTWIITASPFPHCRARNTPSPPPIGRLRIIPCT